MPIRTVVLVLVVAVAAALPAAASASEGPPAGPGSRHVMFVGNNWDGTATIVDAETFEPLMTINTIPDKDEREQEIYSNPDKLAFFLAIQQFVGEGNHQYTDDMFTNHEGTEVYVSRPSYADVVGIDLATNEIIWRYPMDGYRSDHMAISPDGERLLVSDSTANIVHEIDPETGEGTGTFESGDSPHENVYIHGGDTVLHASIGRVYTPTDRSELGLVRDTSKGERYFQVVDAGTLGIIDRWDIGQKLEEAGHPDMSSAVRPMAPHPDGRRVFFQVSFHHGFVEFDHEAGEVLGVADLPQTASEGTPREEYLLDSAHHGLAMNPEGTKLCVAGTMDDYGAMVATDDYDEVTTEAIVAEGSKPYWSTNGPDGKHCWISWSGDDEVSVLDYATEQEIARVPVGDHPQRVRVGVVKESILGQARAEESRDGERGDAAAPAAQSRTGLPATGGPAIIAVLGLATLGAAAAIRRRS